MISSIGHINRGSHSFHQMSLPSADYRSREAMVREILSGPKSLLVANESLQNIIVNVNRRGSGWRGGTCPLFVYKKGEAMKGNKRKDGQKKDKTVGLQLVDPWWHQKPMLEADLILEVSGLFRPCISPLRPPPPSAPGLNSLCNMLVYN